MTCSRIAGSLARKLMEDKGKMQTANDIKEFRTHAEKMYQVCPTGCGGSFGEILCYEIHSQPVNPRMMRKSFNGGYGTGLTFKELAQKWGITVTFLGELIKDHCEKLED